MTLTVESNNEWVEETYLSIISALNWLHHYGYTKHESQMDEMEKEEGGARFVFS